MFIIYDLERGGPEMRLLELAEHLPSDFRFFICVTSNKLSLLYRFKLENVEVFVIPVTKAYREPLKILKIIGIVRRNRITIINTFDLKGLFIANGIKLFSGVRVTLVHHVVDMLQRYKSRQVSFLRLLLKGVDRGLSNSRAAVKMLGDGFFPQDKIKLIYNGVDVARFCKGNPVVESLRNTLGIATDAFVLGTVANFRIEKEYPFLLKAFKKLSLKYSHLRLICVGGGPLLEGMEKLAAELDVAGKIIFTGYVENVPDYIGLMDIFVLCGSNEGFPNVLIQAMSMEVPIVVTNVGACPDIIDDGNDGFLFTPCDIEVFSSKVINLIEQRELAETFAHKAKEKVNEQFTLEKMVQEYMDYFRSIERANGINKQQDLRD